MFKEFIKFEVDESVLLKIAISLQGPHYNPQQESPHYPKYRQILSKIYSYNSCLNTHNHYIPLYLINFSSFATSFNASINTSLA